MIIIIDGYNLLKRVYPRVKGYLDQQRKQLVKLLGYYARKKKGEIDEIIIVFDAGTFMHASREVHQGVVVVFSGQASCADSWILEYVEKHAQKEKLLVSTDHELAKRCEAFKTNSIDVFEFYVLVKEFVLADTDGQGVCEGLGLSDGVEKYEHDNDDRWEHDVDETALDLLMEEASMYVTPKQNNDKDTKGHKKKGTSRKMSKKERKIHSMLKKQ